jgi:hypothetical protein
MAAIMLEISSGMFRSCNDTSTAPIVQVAPKQYLDFYQAKIEIKGILSEFRDCFLNRKSHL